MPQANPRSDSPGNLLPFRQPESIQEIDVKGVTIVDEVRFAPIRPIIISLNLKVISLPENSLPSSKNISAG